MKYLVDAELILLAPVAALVVVAVGMFLVAAYYEARPKHSVPAGPRRKQ